MSKILWQISGPMPENNLVEGPLSTGQGLGKAAFGLFHCFCLGALGFGQISGAGK
tara:strand:- start:1726 stop:1890 length:165 start_codon:yes stop_codon:yes gene_type:complete